MHELTVACGDGAYAEALIAAMELRDPHTSTHCEEVVELACDVGTLLGIELAELELVARLHDVGKLGIPDAILHKPGPLTQEEWWLMRRHPDIGAALLRPLPGLEQVAALVRFHHERWDGCGYPEGLAREEIPLVSRIVCACDAWAAMRADRSYRRALSPRAAVAELRAGAGGQFDPDVVDVLLAVA
jgi:HD-GYP domain-containing protein (c-di-GMP phosphodiesterase class II)